eukprot:2445463-Lingulodinium_polyedra.AAC.1
MARRAHAAGESGNSTKTAGERTPTARPGSGTNAPRAINASAKTSWRTGRFTRTWRRPRGHPPQNAHGN